MARARGGREGVSSGLRNFGKIFNEIENGFKLKIEYFQNRQDQVK